MEQEITYTEAVWLLTSLQDTFQEASDTDTYKSLVTKLEAIKNASAQRYT